MSYLYDYLKHATLIDLGLVALAIIVALILLVTGIWVVFFAKSKLLVGSYTVLAFLPLLLCLLAVLAQWTHNRNLNLTAENPTAYYASDRSDYVVGGTIGIVLTALPLLIGISGFFIPRRQKASS